jgi:hypothetical protein
LGNFWGESSGVHTRPAEAKIRRRRLRRFQKAGAIREQRWQRRAFVGGHFLMEISGAMVGFLFARFA